MQVLSIPKMRIRKIVNFKKKLVKSGPIKKEKYFQNLITEKKI